MCTVLLPPADNPIAFNKYILSYHERIVVNSGEVLLDFSHTAGEYSERNYRPRSVLILGSSSAATWRCW